MPRDIDYAALAVRKAIIEKFSQLSLGGLDVSAGEQLIGVRYEGRLAQGTRDELLSLLRKSTVYEEFWALLTDSGRSATGWRA